MIFVVCRVYGQSANTLIATASTERSRGWLLRNQPAPRVSILAG